jgi:hypothetical protein
MLNLYCQGNGSKLDTTLERDHETGDDDPWPSRKKRKIDAVGDASGARETGTSSKKTNKKGIAKPVNQSHTKTPRTKPAKSDKTGTSKSFKKEGVTKFVIR